MTLQVGFFFPKLNYNWSKLQQQSVLYVLIQLCLMLNSLRGRYNFKLLPGHTWASCKRCDSLSLVYLAPNIIWRCFFRNMICRLTHYLAYIIFCTNSYNVESCCAGWCANKKFQEIQVNPKALQQKWTELKSSNF